MKDVVAKFDLKWALACTVATLFITSVAWMELQRVEGGDLFLFAFPGEAQPSAFETTDAHKSAVENQRPAVAALVAIGLIVAVAGPASIGNMSKYKILTLPLLFCFAVSVVADLLTTILFFHQTGIDNELHPAIRLLGYAYGRTTGPVLGKAIQALGVVFVALQLKGYGRLLIGFVTIVYLTAAAYNLWQSRPIASFQ